MKIFLYERERRALSAPGVLFCMSLLADCFAAGFTRALSFHAAISPPAYFLGELAVIKLRISAARSEQRTMIALLDDRTVLHDQN